VLAVAGLIAVAVAVVLQRHQVIQGKQAVLVKADVFPSMSTCKKGILCAHSS